MKGVADRDQMMQDMLSQAQPPAPEQEQQDDPKTLLDSAIERVAAYAENPAEVTPETLQELLATLQQVSEALGGGDSEQSAFPLGAGPE